MFFSDFGSTAPSRKRRVRTPLLVLGGVLIVVLLAIGGFAIYLNSLLAGNVRHSPLLPPAGQQVVPRDPVAKDAQNILLIGSDSRTDALGAGNRSDVIQLVHVSSDRQRVDVVHFPRDLYVSIPGHGKSKINASYSWGGAPLLVLTLEKLLRVHIDHVAAISFDGFKQLTDLVGGVDVRVDQPSDEWGYRFSVGVDHLNGKQALAFVRERHQLRLGDIDRGKRQQAWIRAIMVKLRSTDVLANPVKLVGVVKDLTSNLVVDNRMSTGYMRSLALSLRHLSMSDVVFHTAPYDGFGYVDGVGSVDWVDHPRMRELGHALRTDRMQTVAGGTSNPG
jgi:LCP family protein required for cell wall assembly